MIEVKELTKMYGGRPAVDRLSLTAGPGTVTAVLGPAGSGKTSALRLILGLDSPTAGTVTVCGVPPRGRPRSPHQIGALPEPAALRGRRTARAFLRALAREHGIGSGRVAEVLAETGLSREPRRRVATYSPAMRQRLRIAVALLGDPPVLLLDEPLAGLDAEGVRWARRLLRTLAAEGRTVAITGERAAEAADTADRIVVLGRGRVVAAQSSDEFAARGAAARVVVGTPHCAELATVLAGEGATVVRARLSGAGRLAVTGMTAERVGALATEHGIVVLELDTRRPSLEEVLDELAAGARGYVRPGEDAHEPGPAGPGREIA
ncbi:ABC transporter ATP-binding protein [Streptomyces sp. NRRL F-2580]|uniref:ABC transporter ATP-binding protein n=1 Tax=Streptomyces sp. NRRL F-2580 TaxID=1463841 RepID=UPI00068ACFC3|nr:ATP-binding cassette domain-containing protein [Streptomyces sp. NRRL F-2580]